MISLTDESIDYIKKTFDEYEYCPKTPTSFSGRTLIHLYATEDTDDGAHFNGFRDSLFFDVRIYDPDEKKYYEISDRDQVELNIPQKVSIRIFKDGSTILIIDEDFTLGFFQSLEINKV